jgi:hypothetical protein
MPIVLPPMRPSLAVSFRLLAPTTRLKRTIGTAMNRRPAHKEVADEAVGVADEARGAGEGIGPGVGAVGPDGLGRGHPPGEVALGVIDTHRRPGLVGPERVDQQADDDARDESDQDLPVQGEAVGSVLRVLGHRGSLPRGTG